MSNRGPFDTEKVIERAKRLRAGGSNGRGRGRRTRLVELRTGMIRTLRANIIRGRGALARFLLFKQIADVLLCRPCFGD